MEQKAQGAFEYLLLLGGVLLIAVLVVLILRGGVFSQAKHTIDVNTNAWVNLTNTSNCTLTNC